MTDVSGFERFRAFVDQVRSRSHIADVIGDVAELEEVTGGFKCSSPFREDRTPSFWIYPNDERWYDFGLSEGGDVFDFVRRYHNTDFRGAVDILADRAGITWQNGNATDAEALAAIEAMTERRQIEDLLTHAARYYHACLPADLRAHLRTHYGFTDETIDAQCFGFSDGSLVDMMDREFGVGAEKLGRTGLLIDTSRGWREMFEGRIVFPYWLQGRVRYMIGRRHDGYTSDHDWNLAKYKKLLTHSDRSPYVSKTVSNEWFYGEDDAYRKVDVLLITEGVTDCAAARQGKVACISPVTTSFREKDWPRLIALTSRAKSVVIINDPDSAGAAGAMKTAAHLYGEDRDVKIGKLPPRNDGQKNDLNLFLRDGGNLAEALEEAKRYLDTLIDDIPADTAPEDLADKLKTIAVLIAQRGRIERDAHIKRIARRFGIPKASIAVEVAQHIPSEVHASDEAENVRGTIIEDMADHYSVEGPKGRESISSFVIRPKRFIDYEDGSLICGDVVVENGKTFTEHVFDKSAWLSSRSLLAALPHPSCTWTGTDQNVQGLARLLTEGGLPSQKGTKIVGLHEHKGQRVWVTPRGTYGIEGKFEDPPITYVDTHGSAFHGSMSLADSTEDEATLAARIVLPLLHRINAPEVILPAIGFFFAAPFAPDVRKFLGHFPILFVWGTPGGGKTSTVCDVFLPICGLVNARPVSATETEFALVRAMSGSNSVPLFIDEFKSDMGLHRVNRMMRLLRRVYGGEVEERGNANQRIRTYELASPIVVAGESYPGEDPAIRERLLPINPNPNFLIEHPEARKAFEHVTRADLQSLAPSLVRMVLDSTDTKDRLIKAKESAKNLLLTVGSPDVPPRSLDALTTALFGIDVFERFAERHGVDLGDLDLEPMGRTFCEEILTGEGRYTKDQFDMFIESLSTMALMGEIADGKHYILREGKLLIHLRSCYAAYLEAMKRTGQGDQTAGLAALKRTMKEKASRGSYVTKIDERATMNNGRVRCVEIDVAKVPDSLDFELFPGKVRDWGGFRSIEGGAQDV